MEKSTMNYREAILQNIGWCGCVNHEDLPVNRRYYKIDDESDPRSGQNPDGVRSGFLRCLREEAAYVELENGLISELMWKERCDSYQIEWTRIYANEDTI